MAEGETTEVNEAMISLTHDGSSFPEPAERCCFCRTPTRYWFQPKDVAVCQDCAEHMTVAEVPTKDEWFAKENAIFAQMKTRLGIS